MNLRQRAGAVALAVFCTACASAPRAPVVTTPKFPAYAEPVVPPDTVASPDVLARHRAAWQWLQAGQPRRAAREFQVIVKAHPQFFPALSGLGYAHLADRDLDAAEDAFARALSVRDAYLPAWVGRAEADVARGDDPAAMVALERVLALDPSREGVRTRLDLVRFRYVQTLIERGTAASSAARWDDARRDLERALALSPSSTAVLRALAAVEQAAGNLPRAEAHARRLVQVDAGAAEHLALLAAILEAQHELKDAATLYARAAALDPREPWRASAERLRLAAEAAALPEAIRRMASARTVTRGDVAAYLGTRLEALLAAAPRRPVQVATDLRGHWSAPWIPAVTRSGVMPIFQNHTFQPQAVVRRGDLAQILASVLELPGAARSPDLVRWRAARPSFSDLPATHVLYRPAALAVAAGVMSAESGNRFVPTREATGAELVEGVDRIAQMTQRR